MTGSKQRHRRRHRPLSHTSDGMVALRASTVLLDISPLPHANDAVLARAREQWQQGDWQGLAQTPLESIEHHPQRARLALLLAAGHQQLGRIDAARRCATQALAWGCERRAVAQVLISGIHSTLARAAAIDDDAARSRRHLEAALSMAYPGQDVQALMAQRQLAQTDWRPPARSEAPKERHASNANPALNGVSEPSSATPEDAAAASAPAAAAAPPADSRVQLQRIMNLRHKLQQELTGLRSHVDHGLQRQAVHQSQLLEAYLRIARALDGRPDLPTFQGWAVSADLGAHLMDRVAQGGFDAIVEFGSGSSTLLMALAIARAGTAAAPGRPTLPLQLALEHLPEHHARTQALLARHAPGHGVRLVLAPLVPWSPVADSPPALFYDGQDALSAVAAALASLPRAPRLLVLVDGPPASTGPQARYPALPALLQHFGHAEVECIVDDYGRPDDRAVVGRWLAELQAAGRDPKLHELPFLKAACCLRWTPPPTAGISAPPR